MRPFVPAIAAGLLLAQPALADAPGDGRTGPLCARTAVLERVGEALRQAGRPMRLEPYPIGEVSGPGALVSCAIRARLLAYDTNRDPVRPQEETLVVRYTLELRHNGIFVRVQ